MRIDAYNQLQQIYSSKKPSVAEEKKTSASSFKDQLMLSAAAQDAAIAKQAAASAPDVRVDLVNSLKEQIDSGTYEVDTEDFAGRLLEKYNGLF